MMLISGDANIRIPLYRKEDTEEEGCKLGYGKFTTSIKTIDEGCIAAAGIQLNPKILKSKELIQTTE